MKPNNQEHLHGCLACGQILSEWTHQINQARQIHRSRLMQRKRQRRKDALKQQDKGNSQ